MITVLWIIATLLGIIILAYQRASASVATVAGSAFLILVTVFSPFYLIFIVLLWALLIIFAVFFNATPIRKYYLSKPLFTAYLKGLPTMSKTEREAIDVGTVAWAGELFAGAPNWEKMLSQPKAELSAEEQAFLDGPVEELCKRLNDWDITHNRGDLPEEVWKFIKANKFFAMIIPKKFGGLEFSAVANSAVVAKVSAISITAGTTICVPNSLGPAELLHKYGTHEQQAYYLPRLAIGEEIPCFALTGPTAGSDAASMPDLGVVCKGQFENKEIIGIRLNFNKRYITLAPVATVIGLAFHLIDPDHLIGKKEDVGISCALLPRNLKGISVGRRHFALNTPFQNGPVQGKDVFIPLDYLIGGVAMAGRGWAMLVQCLSVGRGISLPALAIGGAKSGILTSGVYCRIRQQFGLPIGKFEGVEEAYARAIANTYMMDATRKMTLASIDRGEKPAVLTAITKLHVTELGREVSNDVMDIHGGKGICLGPNNTIGRGYQSIPISITVEGANILSRSMIVFGQGAIRCHPYVFQEMHAVQDEDKERGLKQFDKAIFGHIGFIVSNFVRSLVFAFTSSKIAAAPKGISKRYFQHFTRFSSAFAFLADVSMIVIGGDLKRKESLSARLGDVLSFLYIGSAVLKQYHDDEYPKEDAVLIHYTCQSILHAIQVSMDGVLRNFPNKILASFLRVVLFPLGKHFHKPRDILGHKIVTLFLSPTATRARLTKGLSLSSDAIHPIGRIEETFSKMIAIEPIEKRIKQAIKEKKIKGYRFEDQVSAACQANVITVEEQTQLLEAHAARMALINVDDFDPKELSRV